MKPYYSDDFVTLYHGDCLQVMAAMPDASVDAVVTDPPYGLEFMGKDWDGPKLWREYDNDGDRGYVSDGRTAPKFQTARPSFSAGLPFQRWCEAWAAECLRVLKPGGHMLAFGGTRTWHRLACAVEDAGFEIRDSIAWLYGSGFPKSLDVSKAIDKAAGAVGIYGEPKSERHATMAKLGRRHGPNTDKGWLRPSDNDPEVIRKQALTYEGASVESRRWQGWGSAMKPAFEPVVVARKPLIGTIAQNVLAHGTGALNIDATRVQHDEPAGRPSTGMHGKRAGIMGETVERYRETTAASTAGRWPANVVLDESQAEALDEQSGTLTSGGGVKAPAGKLHGFMQDRDSSRKDDGTTYPSSTGGASRFFPTFRYEAKAPASERPKVNGTAHPTVKPLSLMSWLVRLVTPPGGTVLEPFAGSGTTAEACVLEGFHCIAIERESDYLPLIVARLSKPMQMGLDFGDAS